MHAIPAGIDLDACLFGGQAFTWWRAGERIEGIARGTRFTLDVERGQWTSSPGGDQTVLARYLGAKRGKPGALVDDPELGSLASQLDGLRLLDQDPWEGTLAFMLSPVNNVPRIQETMARLVRVLGSCEQGALTIPAPEAVARAGEKRLREVGAGFRAPRIHALAKRIAEGTTDLERMREQPIEQAHQALLGIDGIGPKVAECILCYALGFDDAFPVDRWVARACETVLGETLAPAQARERWGTDAAMAQQLLFHGARMGLIDGLDASPVARFDGWRAIVGEPPG